MWGEMSVDFALDNLVRRRSYNSILCQDLHLIYHLQEVDEVIGEVQDSGKLGGSCQILGTQVSCSEHSQRP